MKAQREHWGSYLGMIMAAAGSAIGLGTLWKFPYVTGQNGGGLFVFLYLICTLAIGIPLFIGELILGRRAQRGAVGSFIEMTEPATKWQAVGWMGVASSFLIMTYYSVISGWGLNYLFMSLCQFYQGKTPQEITGVFDILYRSADISLFWHVLFTLITVGVVFQGIRKGIEYWSRIMTTGLLVLLLGLFFYSTQLEGFSKAAHFIFYPDLSKFSATGALEAVGLSFFTLSLGQGIIITYGSYMKRSEDPTKTALIIGGSVILISLLSAMMIFPMVFTYGLSPQEGFSLVFKTLPVLFSQMPGALLISVAFFSLLVFTALTSAIALVEVVAANMIDLFGWTRKKAVWCTGIASAIVGIPSALAGAGTIFGDWTSLYGKNFFLTVDNLVSVWLLPVGGGLTAVFMGWRIHKSVSYEEFCQGSRFGWMYRPWLFLIRWVAPAAILMMILQQSGLIDLSRLTS